jgi:hypothetical protein
VLDPELLGQPPGGDDRSGAVPRDPLVDRQRDESDRRTSAKVPMRRGERDGRILAARERDRDGP